MCLGYHITEAYLQCVIPSAGLHEIIQQPVSFLWPPLWPPLPSNINLSESSLSINVMDCSTNVV